MHEITINLHMHTRYSDGHGSHSDIVRAALDAGLDAVIVTDHNVWIKGPEGYVQDGTKRVLLLIGEELHDAARDPQKSHLLAFGADRELAHLAQDPQQLINGVRDAGGICFLAHPYDEENALFKETAIDWADWDVQGYTGIELWNGLSEFKSRLKSILHAIYFAYLPYAVPAAPPAVLLAHWDRLLLGGRRVVAVGGSDAHQLPGRLGPLKRMLFPYGVHFRCINTHLLLPQPLTGHEDEDRALILDALRAGHAFVANDAPAPARGFRFTGQGPDGDFVMGDEVRLGAGVTLQVRLPERAECILICDGQPVKTWTDREAMVVNVDAPGVYRVEVWRRDRGRRRGWIFSNPVYVR